MHHGIGHRFADGHPDFVQIVTREAGLLRDFDYQLFRTCPR